MADSKGMMMIAGTKFTSGLLRVRLLVQKSKTNVELAFYTDVWYKLRRIVTINCNYQFITECNVPLFPKTWGYIAWLKHYLSVIWHCENGVVSRGVLLHKRSDRSRAILKPSLLMFAVFWNRYLCLLSFIRASPSNNICGKPTLNAHSRTMLQWRIMQIDIRPSNRIQVPFIVSKRNKDLPEFKQSN